MKINKNISKLIWAGIVTLMVLSSFTSMAMITSDTIVKDNNLPVSESRDSLPYDGTLRVYIIEPESRWDMYDGQPYHYALLDIVSTEQLSIDYLDTYQDTITWNGEVYEDNIMVMAAVFNPEGIQQYAYPPSENPFDAYYVDAAAGAHPGETGYNTVIENFTHTVFIEEGTATWCQFCPAMGHDLHSIYDSGDYPFYYVALVTDMNSDAQARINQYNIGGYPTAFFDGGYKVKVGGTPGESPYRSRIISSGKRDVHELNLSLSLEWLGGGNLQIDVSITNNEVMNPPETPEQPSGPTDGNVGIEYTYTANTTDPNDDRIYYLFDWGDGSDSGWVGPHNSGATATAKHTWDEEGDYEVKVKAKDTGGGGHETDWSDPLSVHIEPPVFLITVTGELFGVVADIVNNGIDELPTVDWSITVTGGILDRINSYRQGTVENLAPEESITVKTNETIFGFGKIDITVTAETTVYSTTGFVFGPFILVR